MTLGEKLELKLVNIYKMVHVPKMAAMLELMRLRDLLAQYGMHYSTGSDFRAVMNMYIWWED